MADKKKVRKLSNIDVHIISLVDKGANQKHIVWKSGDKTADDCTLTTPFQIAKVDVEKRMVYGIVYSPNQVDSQGDFATADEIEKASINFMKKSQTHAIDKQHDMVTKQGVILVENWIIKSNNDPVIKNEKGAWAVGLYVDNDEIWEAVKKGEYGGLSMYGFANVEEVEEDQVSKQSAPVSKKDKVVEFFKELFNDENESSESDELIKDFNSQYDNLNFRKIGNAFQDAIWQIMNDEEITDKKAAVLESIAQMQKLVEGVEVAKSEFAKAGKVLSEKNLSALKTAISSINTILESAEKVEKGDYKMSQEKTELQKQFDELQKKFNELSEKLEKKDGEDPKEETKKTVEEELADVKKELDELKKKSTGTNQNIGAESGEPEKVTKHYSFLGDLSDVEKK